MSLTKKASKDTSGEPGATRRDALLLVLTMVLLLNNAAMTFGGVAIGTTTTKVSLGQQIDYCIDGRNFRKAATVDLWTLTGAAFGSATTTTFTKYLLLLDTAGVASVVQCSVVTGAAASVVIPDLFVALDNKSLIGVLTIQAVNVVFTPGTTTLNAGGITATYVDGLDVSMMPLLVDESNIAYKA